MEEDVSTQGVQTAPDVTTMEEDVSTQGVQTAPDVAEQEEEELDSDNLSSDNDTDTADDADCARAKKSSSSSSSASSMECSDAEDEETSPQGGWMSKSGEIQWAPNNDETLRYIPAGTGTTSGPTLYAVSRISNLVDCFNLYLTDEIVNKIVEYTNLHGQSSGRDWTDTDPVEMRAYFGLLLLAGVYRSHNEATRSLWDERTGRSIFRSTMSLKRFHIINAMIQFDHRKSRSRRRGEDKMAAFREVWDKWTARLDLLFNVSRDVCVDEQLVPYRGRCSFRQYVPKKPGRYGLKIWVTADVGTSYAWRMSVYTGKEAGAPPERNQGKRVVLEMTEGLKGVTVTCDHFFTSYALAEELLKKKNAYVGTIRRNKPDLPRHLLQVRKRAVLSSVFGFTQKHTVVSYVPKHGKNLLLLSTRHRDPAVSSHPKKKPEIIMDYNRCKGAVDNLDKLIGTYTCRRVTKRWPLVLFFNVLDVSAFNGFVLWTSINETWEQKKSFRRRLFLDELGKSLTVPLASRRQPVETAADRLVSKHCEPLSLTRKRCIMCKTRRHVVSSCRKCGVPVCKEHYITVCNACF